jgi:hypothetical protein
LPPDAIGMSTSSRAPCPTSPTHWTPVTRSKLKRHGLRNPNAKISSRPGVAPKKGLVDGAVYTPGVLTSIRKIFPRRTAVFCALFGGSWAEPPSPTPI